MSMLDNNIKEYINFDDFDLNESLLRGIYAYGYEKPSPIQSKCIKPIIDGKDIIAQSQSGSGKTATFLIGNLNRINIKINKPQILILAPNRELATQIYNVMNALNIHLKASSTLLIGGTSIDLDIKELDSGKQIIIGTPGRIFDMIKRYVLQTNNIISFILDEADEMLSRGFKDQIYNIFEYIPKQSQVCLFSATMPEQALEITKTFMKDPFKILVESQNVSLLGLDQYYFGIQQESWKIATIFDLYEKLSLTQSIIFANSKRKVDFVKQQLDTEGYDSMSLHAEMSQKERDDIMTNFRQGKIRILITTDIIARGID